MGMPQTAPADALSEDWLGRTSQTRAYYGGLRDHYEPGTPLWVTEVADAACGGNPWAATFLDTFRYLDQLGRLAKDGAQVVMHNTLAASDYGLLNENDFTPKPHYWAALLWHRFMGSTVLDSGVPIQQGLHLYATYTRTANPERPAACRFWPSTTTATRPARWHSQWLRSGTPSMPTSSMPQRCASTASPAAWEPTIRCRR
jgi:hypothetical protein